MKLWLVLVGFLLLQGCGKAKNNNNLKFQDELNENLLDGNLEELPLKTTYVATLNPVNPNNIGFSSGSVTIDLEGDFMVTNVRFSGPLFPAVHIQNIHAGSFCPTEISDSNQDGYIDILESLPFTQDVLIPMDGDLNSQLSGGDFFPQSDNWGSYVYSKVSSYLALLNDLYAPDENTNDLFSKIIKDTPLFLDERVVVIYGIPETENLPDTVATFPGFTKNQIIPIACGVFSKVASFPGTMEGDDITVGRIGRPNSGNAGNSGANTSTPRRNIPNSESGRGNGNQPNTGETSPGCTQNKVCD